MPKTLEEVIEKHYLSVMKISAFTPLFYEELAQAIRQWIDERLPKAEENEKIHSDNMVFGYNQALKDVRQAIGEE